MASRRVLALLLLAGACTRTTLKQSAVDEYGGADEMAKMDFWDEISTHRAVSNDDALHALALQYALPPAADHAGRVEMGRSRGWIAADAELKGAETARAGWIALAVCRESGVKGGLTMRVFGPRERYAVNELNYRGWLPGMSPEQALSGLQLIALLSKAEDAASRRPDEPREDFK